jgi:protein ImuB
MRIKRIGCLWAPDFPLAVCLRKEPNLSDKPLVILQEEGTVLKILAATVAAQRHGVGPGLSLPQGRALYPSLTVLRRDVAAERAAQEKLLEVAESFSPVIEEGDLGIVYLDLSGTRKEESEERFIGETMIRRAATVGLTASVGIAGSRLAARVAAEFSGGAAAVIPNGEEANYLAPLPIDLLHPPPKLNERFKSWGIASMGALARLDPGEIERRLGEEGLRLHRAARGIDERPLIRWRRPAGYSEAARVDWPLCEIDSLLFLARQAIERLLARLDADGLSCRGLEMTLLLDTKGTDARALSLPAPTRDPKTLLSLLRLEIESKPPAAPVIGLTLVARPDRPRQIQSSLFGPPTLSPERFASVLARLSALVGPKRIGSPVSLNGHLPERFRLSSYAPPPPPKMPPVVEKKEIRLAIRVLRPMIELDVIEEETKPIAVRSLSGRTEIRGSVRVASGPWRIEEGWWSEESIARDYWDVELSDGGVYRIFHDSLNNRWFADGIYD